MADFIRARAYHAYSYEDAESTREMVLLHPGWIASPVQTQWETRRASFDYVGRDYGEEVAQGNARCSISYDVYIRRQSVAELERDLDLMERALNLHPHGKLAIYKAYAAGNPLLMTEWTAHVATASARGPIPGDEAPAIEGAWGILSLEIILTNPQDL